MAGIKGKSGGARPGAGRKPKSNEDELHSLLDTGWPATNRHRVIETLAARAEATDMRAVALLLAYAYGTPKSGDEITKQEAVDAEISALLEILEKNLSAAAWDEVREVLCLE